MSTSNKRAKEPRTSVQEEWVDKTVRQREAPLGYRRNVGRVFVVADATVEGDDVLLQAAKSGDWVPSSHVEVVGAVTFTSDDRDRTEVVLATNRHDYLRLDLNQDNMTVDGLIALFQSAIDWLRGRNQADVEVGID